MRMRRKKNGAARLKACAGILMPEEFTSFEQIFVRSGDIRLEIGCGKGDFVCGTAEAEPEANYIAVERISDVLMLAAEKVASRGIPNIRLMCLNAAELADYFPEGSISRVYLNFSDPWQKKGYAKRRLTHRNFLEIYKKIMTPDGSLFLKTDDDSLFDFSLGELEACGFRTEAVTRDLHNSEYAQSNIMTEYERNFAAAGKHINSLRAYL